MIERLDCAMAAALADTPPISTDKGYRTMTISIRRTVLTAGAIALLGLAAIGLVQAASSTGTAPTTPLANAPLAAAPITATSAALSARADAVIASELDAILAADQTTAAQPAAAGREKAGPGLRRLRLGRHLVHATIVLDLPEKGLTTIQVDHGTISTVGATSIAIAETGGTSVTVSVSDETRVRRNGAKAKVTDLKNGDEVFVMSKVESGGTLAYLVVVPKK
jgi:hypothetical protein